jgi:hypothetical protein
MLYMTNLLNLSYIPDQGNRVAESAPKQDILCCPQYTEHSF